MVPEVNGWKQQAKIKKMNKSRSMSDVEALKKVVM